MLRQRTGHRFGSGRPCLTARATSSTRCQAPDDGSMTVETPGSLKESRRPVRRNNCRRGVWVPDRRSLCSLVRDDGVGILRTTFRNSVPMPRLSPSSSPGLSGRSSIPETSMIEPRSRGVLGPPLSRRTTVCVGRLRCHFQTWFLPNIASHSRGMICPSFAATVCPLIEEEGAGNAGCALHPRSRVQIAQRNAHTSIQVQRRQSGIPCAMVLRLMPRSPRRRIRLVTVAAGLMAIPIRLDRYSHRQLGTSNGCRDHTILPYADSAVRLRAGYSLTGEPALRLPIAPDAAASTASHPASVTTRDPPLLSGWDDSRIGLSLPGWKAEYFSRRGWTTQIALNSWR
jgi:hypothetical protein